MFKKSNYQGKIIADASPSGIEKFLKVKIENALGNLKEDVTISPILKIDEHTSDMSGDVKSGFGAVAITVNNVTLHVPFIMRDREFLPFDSIRMGQQQVAYEEGKLKKLVSSIKDLNIDGEGNVENDDFNPMELGDIEDLPFDNGFLGTIMSIRDHARSRDHMSRGMHTGQHFGDMTDERMVNLASVDVGEIFEDFHEKLANVQKYTKDDILKVANDMREQFIADYDKVLSAQNKPVVDKTKDLLKRKADEIKLIDYRVANNGKFVEFPIVDGNSSTRGSGILYKDLVRPKTDNHAAKKGYNALLIDHKGSFKLIHDKDELLIYKDRKLSEIKLKMGEAHTIRGGIHAFYALYTNEDKTQITIPFKARYDYITKKEQDGSIKSFSDLTADGGTFFTSVQSTLFNNVILAEDMLESYADFGKEFLIVIAREGKGIEPGKYTTDEIKRYILKEAENERDINVSMEMFNYFYHSFDTVYVLKPKSKVLNFKDFGINTISKKEELLGFSKEASYDSQNKVRLYINEKNYPPTYNVSIQYTQAADAGGVAATQLKHNNINHLSEQAARKVLSDIGYSHTKIDEFFEGVKRSGRYSEFPSANEELSSKYIYKDETDGKVKNVIKGMINSTLNANNYIPVMQDVIADSISGVAKLIMSEKIASSLEVAQSMEKRANETRDLFDSNVAMLLNMKHNLDKMASDINEGYLTRCEDVFESIEKISHILPGVSEELYYKQFRNTEPIYKEAMLQLDGLTQHLLIGDNILKEANFKRKMNAARKTVSNFMTTPKKKEVISKRNELSNINDQLKELSISRDKMAPYAAVNPKSKAELSSIQEQMKQLMDQRVTTAGDLSDAIVEHQSQNRKFMAAVGLPGTTFLSYKINED